MKKIIILSFIVIILLVGNIFIYNFNTYIEKDSIKPQVFYSSQGKINSNNVWCETLGLAWNELKNYVGNDIEFENDTPELVQKLNQRVFSKDTISDHYYYIKVSKLDERTNKNLKEDIYKELNKKFKINGNLLLDDIDISSQNGIFIYSMLKKQFHFLEEFDNLKQNNFTDIDGKENIVNFFGINEKSEEKLNQNVEILYFKDYYSFILKLKTKESEEVILYKTEDISNYSLDELYDNAINLSNGYQGKKKLEKNDILSIPYINLNFIINYDELCNKEIQGTNGEYISTAMQNIDFSLTNSGGIINSEALVVTDQLSAPLASAEYYEFNSPFVIFIKENNKDKPYFMTKILDTTFLVND